MHSYAKAPACTVSGLVVTDVQTGKQVSGVDVAKQWFKPIPEEVRRSSTHAELSLLTTVTLVTTVT